MSYPMNEIREDVENLADNTGALMDCAKSAAAERYDEARNRLTAILGRGRDMYGFACKRAVRDKRTADGVLHDNLYQTILIGIGVGAVLGFLFARRGTFGSD
jgi:ElaB/YqjD/DUF883 family membrane-anchored ribosome-binding protein